MFDREKCLRCSSPMEEILTKKGVLIDVCSSCKGVWLDQGELNFFAHNTKILNHYEVKGLEESHKIIEKCPKCQSQMQVGRIPGFPHQVEECLTCKGIFFDAHEFKKFQAAKEFKTIRRGLHCFHKQDFKDKNLPLCFSKASLALFYNRSGVF